MTPEPFHVVNSCLLSAFHLASPEGGVMHAYIERGGHLLDIAFLMWCHVAEKISDRSTSWHRALVIRFFFFL